ncbi:MAG: S8 family serine peptidase [Terracidiphilus sp.]
MNEQHELGRGIKEGGSVPRYAPIDWSARGKKISGSLRQVKREIEKSLDPLRDSHYFIVAKPEESIKKLSKDKTKAPPGEFATVVEHTDFSGAHSRVFNRLGLDLIRVTDEGSAVVHLRPEILDQLASTSESLERSGKREQARWVAFDEFQAIPVEVKLDEEWMNELPKDSVADAVIEFQPLLTIIEIDRLIRAVGGRLQRSFELITGTGSDFSGRQWLRGRLLPSSILDIAKTFFSVQSLHSPLISHSMAAQKGFQKAGSAVSQAPVISSLPTIAVVDTGTPADHAILGPYKRGAYTAPTAVSNSPKRHASFVASRAVFGDVDYDEGIPGVTPYGSARFFDVHLGGAGYSEIEDKSVLPALSAVVATSPDVRIFNLSFDTDPLDHLSSVKRSEMLTLVQDLDNFVFQNDVVVVISAGNSPPGIQPESPYPAHFDDPRWSLGSWARSFNSLTCGAIVGKLSAAGLAQQIGWPSPFSRVGPGLCSSPKPDFVENGGNTDSTYNYAAGLGVWGLTDTGFWEDRCGTSYAAPLLCRQVADAFLKLDTVCEKGARPYGVTAKAFLFLTSVDPPNCEALGPDFRRALGSGIARVNRLRDPVPNSAVFIWQGVLEDSDDIAHVQIPVPKGWLADAADPHLKLVVAWDPPVNAAISNLWATRSVSCQLRNHPDAKALRGRTLHAAPTYADPRECMKVWAQMECSERRCELQEQVIRVVESLAARMGQSSVLVLRHYPSTFALAARDILRINCEMETFYMVAERLSRRGGGLSTFLDLSQIEAPEACLYPHSVFVVRKQA